MKTNTSIIFILSFLFLGSTVFLIWYMNNEIIQKIEVVRVHHLKEKQNGNFEFGNQLKINGEALKIQEETIKKAFLNSTKMVDFITQLETTGQNIGLKVSVEKIEYGTSELVENTYTVQPVSFNIEIIGPYSQIKNFLDTVTQSKEVLFTKEIKLYKTGEAGSVYTARIIISGTILTQ